MNKTKLKLLQNTTVSLLITFNNVASFVTLSNQVPEQVSDSISELLVCVP